MLHVVFLVSIMILAPVAANANLPSHDPCIDLPLPTQVTQALAHKFPSWRPLKMEDLVKDDQELWSQAKGDTCPGFAAGHFESMKSFSYAVVLVRTDRSKGYKLVILTADASGRYKLKVIFEEKRQDSERYTLYPVVHSLPIDEYQDFYDSSKKVRIHLEGIALERLEAWMIMFYWKSGRFEKLLLSD